MCVTLFRNRLCLLTYRSILRNKCMCVLAVELAGRGPLLRHLSCYVESNNCHCWPFGFQWRRFSSSAHYYLNVVRLWRFCWTGTACPDCDSVLLSTPERHVQRAGQLYMMYLQDGYATSLWIAAQLGWYSQRREARWEGHCYWSFCQGQHTNRHLRPPACMWLPNRVFNTKRFDKTSSFVSSLPVQMFCLVLPGLMLNVGVDLSSRSFPIT